jgi:ubiquinone/menaquinone biosynthesis C-methylase UbiE
VPFYEAVFDALGIGPGTQLLDVGCGAGLALQLAAKRGATVTGLDASEGLVAVARRRNPDGDIRVGELEELPFPDGVYSAATLHRSTGFCRGNLQAPLL